MDRLILALVIAVAAIAVAALIRRRRPDAPTQGSGHVPTQVDRNDFRRPDAAYAVLVFTSATCASCAEIWAQVSALSSERIATQEVEVGDRPDLHERYHVDAVPLVVAADSDGVVRRWFLGPTARGEIAEAVRALTT